MQSKVGEIYDGTITGLTTFGAFVRLPNGETGMVHISEVSSSFVKDIASVLSEGQNVKVKIIGINENQKISLSIKQAADDYIPRAAARTREPRPAQGTAYRNSPARQAPVSENASAGMSFEDMMAKFKKDSDEKISVLKKNTDFRSGGRRGGRS